MSEQQHMQLIPKKKQIWKKYYHKKAKLINNMEIDRPIYEKYENKMVYLCGQIILPIDYKRGEQIEFNIDEFSSRYKNIEQIKFNKNTNAIETYLTSKDRGIIDMGPLIQFLLNQQDQLLFKLADCLKNYQKFIVQQMKRTNKYRIQLKNDESMLTKLNQQFKVFEQWADDFVKLNFSEEFYFQGLFKMNYEKGYFESAKFTKSANLISLFGYDLDDAIEIEICKLRNKFINAKDRVDYKGFVEILIQRINNAMQFECRDSVDTFFQTVEGYVLPVKLNGYTFYYQDFNKDPNFIFLDKRDYVLIVEVFNIELVWVERLIKQRQELETISQNLKLCKVRDITYSDDSSSSQKDQNNNQLETNEFYFLDNEQSENQLKKILIKKKNQKQLLQYSNIDYQCQVELFMDKFYNSID